MIRSHKLGTLCVLLMISLVRCSCSDASLQNAGSAVPRIDVCVVPQPGADEVCYEALKADSGSETCEDSSGCSRPELSADFGRLLSGQAGSKSIHVHNVGEVALTFYNPALAPGSSDLFRLSGASSLHEGGVYAELSPGESVTFDVGVDAAACGSLESRWVLMSNDGERPADAPPGRTFGEPDNPIYLNLSAWVGGPCLCPTTSATLHYGEVPVGTHRTERFGFESCGDEPLEVYEAYVGQANVEGVFTVDGQILPEGSVLLPGEQGQIDIRYAPTQLAPPSDVGELWLMTNAPTAQPFYSVLLQGEGVERPSCELGTFPEVLSFGQAGGAGTRTVRVFNQGQIACRVIDAYRASGSTEYALMEVLPAEDEPLVLEPDQSVELDVSYTPSGSPASEAVFKVVADDIYGITTETEFVAYANPTGGDGCVLDVQPSYGDFGGVSLGELTSIQFSLSNLSEGDFFSGRCVLDEIALVDDEGDFRLGDMSELSGVLGILPGDFLDTSLTVFFEPQSEGIKTGMLRIVSNDMYASVVDIPLYGQAMGAELCISGDGQVPASLQCGTTQPCELVDFGTVETSVVRDVTLTNCGAGTLRIRGLELDGASAQSFVKEFPLGDALPLELEAGESNSVRIRYSPQGAQGDFGALTVLSNAAGASEARIHLAGHHSGECERILRCEPHQTGFGTVEVDSMGIRSVTCSNFGIDTLSIDDVVVAGAPVIALESSGYASLAPGEQATFQFSCQPTSEGSFSATAQVLSNACDGSPIELALGCQGLVPELPECFGSGVYQPLEKWRWTGSTSYPGFDDVWATPVVINLTDDNGDGHVDVLDIPDVIFPALDSRMEMFESGGQEAFCHANDAEPAVVIAVSGDDGSTIWEWGRLPEPGNPGDSRARAVDSEAQLAAADIDGDGLAEIIGVKYTYIPPQSDCEMTDPGCCIRGKFAHGALYALEHDGSFKWESETWHLPQSVIENGGAPAIGDMNGDGWPEIAFGNAVFSHQGVLLFEGETESTMQGGQGEGGAGHGPMSVFVDLDGDGSNELVAGRTAFRFDGQVMWDRSDLADGLSTVANVDADGHPELILFTGSNELYVLEHDGTTKYGPVHIRSGNIDEDGQEEGFITTNPAVGDVDGDGYPEIVISATHWVYVFEHTLDLKWQAPSNDQTGASGPTTFDFEGDGRAEVVYADEGSVYIWDGVTGATKYQASRGSRTIFDNPVIVDVDNDGHAEILLAMETPLGGAGMHGLIAYSNQAGNWVGTRRIWNQHSYHISNITESGIVPAHEGAGWLEHNVYRSNVVMCE